MNNKKQKKMAKSLKKWPPNRKVKLSTFAIAVATLVGSIVEQNTDLELTTSQVGSFTTIVGGLVGYFSKPDEGDGVQTEE